MTKPEQEYEIYIGPVPSEKRRDTMKCCYILELPDDTVIQPGLFYFQKNFPGAKVTECLSNPLEPIIEAADRLNRPTTERIRLLVAESAISKCMAIVEGGKK